MKAFSFHQTTKLLFGSGRINELGETAKTFGNKVLLVTTPPSVPALQEQYQLVKNILTTSGLEVFHFDGVVPNPTLESIREGSDIAKARQVDLIIGLGGGSSIDSAKAISVEATHPGTCWDYLFFKKQPDPALLLPVIAVSTTSGTGSHVTQVAVVTNTNERNKSALYNNILYPQIAVIDPQLMLTVPGFVTACTGFDVFCHSFESVLHPNSGAYVNMMAWDAIETVITTLPGLLEEPRQLQAREKMAWADTLAGLCIANAGVTLPHGMGMAIGGMYPHIAHGEALAIVYPAFMDFTWKHDIRNFAKLARILNPNLNIEKDEQAASEAPELMREFLRRIKLYHKLSEVSVPENELGKLAQQCMVLPDYQANPRIATEIEMLELVKKSY